MKLELNGIVGTVGRFSNGVTEWNIRVEYSRLDAPSYVAPCYQTLPFVMEYELGGDRAVIIVSALVAILSSSTSVSKDNIGTEECLCRDNLFFGTPEAVTTAKWRDVLSSLLRLWPYQGMKHTVSHNGEFIARYC